MNAAVAGSKKPFDVGVALQRIDAAIRPWPKAALFQLASPRIGVITGGHYTVVDQPPLLLSGPQRLVPYALGLGAFLA